MARKENLLDGRYYQLGEVWGRKSGKSKTRAPGRHQLSERFRGLRVEEKKRRLGAEGKVCQFQGKKRSRRSLGGTTKTLSNWEGKFQSWGKAEKNQTGKEGKDQKNPTRKT